MKHKVCELDGQLLDAAVAKAKGDALPDFWRDPDDGTCWARPGREEWAPSSRWDQGGPIIERERITIGPAMGRDGWWAGEPRNRINDGYGHTPLIAAMRAYVASKFGEEIEL